MATITMMRSTMVIISTMPGMVPAIAAIMRVAVAVTVCPRTEAEINRGLDHYRRWSIISALGRAISRSRLI